MEIGAGSGVITEALAKRCALVIAIEKDAETCARLRKNLAKRENVKIIQGDFLEIDVLRILREAGASEFKVFSNPPFDISAEIIRKMLELRPSAFYLILQKQFALKMLNNGRHYTSQLGRELTREYATRIRLPLFSRDFTPPPAVPTVLFEAKKIE